MMIYTDRQIAEVLRREHAANAELMDSGKCDGLPDMKLCCEDSMHTLERVAREFGIDLRDPGLADKKNAAPRQRGRQNGKGKNYKPLYHSVRHLQGLF